MPQPVAKTFSAPASPANSLVSTAASKLLDPGATSFKDTLKQAKTKPSPDAARPSKPATAATKKEAKPVASKPVAAKKSAKPAAHKSDAPTKNDSATNKGKVSDQSSADDSTDPNADNGSADDPESDSSPSNDAQSDSRVTDENKDPQADPTGAAQLGTAGQQAVDAIGKSGDDKGGKPGKDSHSGKAKAAADASASQETTADPSTAAAQVQSAAAQSTASDATASNAQDDSQTAQVSDASLAGAPMNAQGISSPRGKAKAQQPDKNADVATEQQSQDPAAGSGVGTTSDSSTDGTASDGSSKVRAGGLAAKAVDDLAAKAGMLQSPADAKSTFQIDSKTAKAEATPPEARFAELNHPTIVSEIHGKLLPDGGAMDIHLSPPDLGAMHVRVEVRDGAVTASFQAADPQTAKLLSHSLSDLKTSLEAQGVNVEKLHVTQMPRENQNAQDKNSRDPNREPDRGQQHAAQQEQQRKEMVRRMWRKLMKGQDPLDLVA